MTNYSTLAMLLAAGSISMSPFQRAAADVIAFEEGVSPTSGYTHQLATVRNDAGKDTSPNNTVRALAGTVGDGALRSIFSFDIAAIPDGATVDSVTFEIYQEDDTGTSVAGAYAVELRTISSSFSENTATWANTFGSGTTLGSETLSTLVMDPEVAATTHHTFASSAAFVTAVQDAIDSDSAFNFALVVPAVENQGSRVVMRFGAEDADTDLDLLVPVLTVNYSVPEPGAIAIIGSGALMMLLRRRKA